MANDVENFRDGQGHLMSAVQWDGDPGTAELIKGWSSNHATLDKRGFLGVVLGHIRAHVGRGAWVCSDAQRPIFILTNAQVKGSYTKLELPASKAETL